jgi:uncharacterized phiE125 gp8 family phage protein
MWRPPVVTVPPASAALSLAQAKAHLRVEGSDEDTLIDDYVAAAQQMVEGMTGVRLVTQTVTIRSDDWDDLARLPIAPVQSVSSITYVDTAGAAQTVSANDYSVRAEALEPAIQIDFGEVWPERETDSLFTVTAVVGYTTVPPVFLSAIRLIVGDLYAMRETAQVGASASQIPSAATVDALLANHRIHLI